MNIKKRLSKGLMYLEKYSDFLAVFISIFFSILFSLMTINNHRLFETYGWDLAVFDQGVWQYSNLKFPFSSFHDLYWLADHFHPILALLSPFYRLIPNVRVLLVAQALLTYMASIPLYLLSKRLTKSKIFSLVIVIFYCLYYPAMWHTFSGFHEYAFFPMAFFLMAYFWEVKRYKYYLIFLILTLLVKEEMGFLVSAFGLWGLAKKNHSKKYSIFTIFIGFAYTILITNYLMPRLSDGVYRHSGFGKYGNSVFDVLVSVIKNPFILITSLLDSSVKIKTLFVSFWPSMFLPFFSPSGLIIIYEQIIIRFIDYEKTIRWTPYFAYSLSLGAVISWAGIYGYINLKNKLFKKVRHFDHIFSVVFLLAIVFQTYLLHSPVNSIFKKNFYRTESYIDNNQNAIKCIPGLSSLSAQNNLAPHLSQREEIKVFPEGIKNGYDYIIVDFREGQSDNSFHFLGREKSVDLILKLVGGGYYERVCQFGDASVYRKIYKGEFDLELDYQIEIYEK